jgi:hypothetical protein
MWRLPTKKPSLKAAPERSVACTQSTVPAWARRYEGTPRMMLKRGLLRGACQLTIAKASAGNGVNTNKLTETD